MCGISGFWAPTGMDADYARSVAGGMSRRLGHRGPDGGGVWCEAAAGLALAHRRLAIVDLSDAAAQPMASRCGRFVVALNGEVYNHNQLREMLVRRGHAFATRSDTEVLLAGVLEWGVRHALARVDGMFAFALWDARERTLVLARDRFGEKPLYYGCFGGTLLFASELKALRAHPAFDARLDPEAVSRFLRHSFVPAPLCIFQGVHKLPPGSFLRLHSPGDDAAPVAYWSAAEEVQAAAADPIRASPTEAAAELERLLAASVRLRMQADVPAAALLSGGIDSSTVAALMQSQSARPVRTFTVGLGDRHMDESGHGQAVARHLGTEHTELRIGPTEALDLIPALPSLYDEPFADNSQIPAHLIAVKAREHVKVLLTGDGGDELFGGYTRHMWLGRLWGAARWVPPAARRQLSRGILRMPPGAWDALLRRMAPVIPAPFRMRTPGDRMHKLASVLPELGPDAMYARLVSHGNGPASDEALPAVPAGLDQWGHRLMYLDCTFFLPEDVLVKVDRAFMGVGLEPRLPFLDPAVFRFAWRLPLGLKLGALQGKWLLRQVLYRHVPPALFHRAKGGFGVPMAEWLRGELRGWAEALLDPARLRGQGLLPVEPVRAMWDDHLARRRNWHIGLWNVLMLQAWLDANPGASVRDEAAALPA
ncbi:asparagine synthase (glutamine-hydrolyzing) [Longimicrobium sp.]|uniref:asparagine synthase (glutamine-hydrolyzing) n=1 Tax=Longimicrobium sp. TaxID=2029185 RepID=UPI003B3B8334